MHGPVVRKATFDCGAPGQGWVSNDVVFFHEEIDGSAYESLRTKPRSNRILITSGYTGLSVQDSEVPGIDVECECVECVGLITGHLVTRQSI